MRFCSLQGWLEKWLAFDSLSYFAERDTSLGKTEVVTAGKEKFEGQKKNLLSGEYNLCFLFQLVLLKIKASKLQDLKWTGF